MVSHEVQYPQKASASADAVVPASGVETQAPAQRAGMSKVGIWVISAAAVLLAVGIYSGIHSRAAAGASLATEAAQSSVPLVRVIYPKAGQQVQQIDIPGNVQPFNDTPIYARTSGYLKRWYVDIGAHVHKGQLLAEIETPELDQQLQQAQSELKNAQANMNMAVITSKRWQNLLAKHAVSTQETDQALTDLTARQAAVAANEANVRRLQQLVSFEHVIAPFDGVITGRNTDIGALVDAGANSTPKELFHLAALHTLRVYIAVPEAYVDAVKNGGSVAMTEVDHPDKNIKGLLVRNSNAIDPQSRTLNAEVDVDNSDAVLLPGAYVMVHLQLPADGHSFTLPANTLLFRSEGLRVAVVRQNHVVLTPVSIGHDYGNTVEITSGLSSQDATVLDPPDSLAGGAVVKVVPSEKGGAA